MEFWPTREVAFFLGITPEEVEGLRQEGTLKAVRRWPRRWLYESESVIAYHAKRTEEMPPTMAASADHAVSWKEILRLSKEHQDEVEARASREIEEDDCNEEPLVRMVNAILSNAIDMDATDIYFEPGRRGMRVRFRIHGALQEVMPIPRVLQRPVARRLMAMADLNPLDEAKPQVGVIRLKHNNRDWNLRVTSLPGTYGVLIAAQPHSLDLPQNGLEALGMPPEIAYVILGMLIKESLGLYLFTGAPGSGTTTTAMAFLCELRKDARALYTLESPIEYELPGINSFALNPARGNTLETLLPLVLKAHPDVLFLGSIDNAQTAQAAVDAAAAGITVLATLHARSIPDAVVRLEHFGITREAQAQQISFLTHQRREGETLQFTSIPVAGYDEMRDLICRRASVEELEEAIERLKVWIPV